MQYAYRFDKETLLKISKGALIAGGAAVIVYALQALSQTDFGSYTPAVVAICGILINVAKEFIKGE